MNEDWNILEWMERGGWPQIAIIILIGLLVGAPAFIGLATSETHTAAVVPTSWQGREARAGNWGLYALSPAFLPLAMGSPEMCWVTFELEGNVREERVPPELCVTQPDILNVRYTIDIFGTHIGDIGTEDR